jgi:hypothetical protein
VAFHDQFWVTVGAAAPVIALSSLVATTDSYRLMWRISDSASKFPAEVKDLYRGGVQAARAILALVGVSLVGQAVALVVALLSLDWWRNVLPPRDIEYIMGFSFLMLITAGLASVTLRASQRAMEKVLPIYGRGPSWQSADPAPPEDGPA